MRRGERLPEDQAEIVVTDEFIEYLEALPQRDQVREVLKDVIRLCEDPAGKHPLGSELAGLNTTETLQKKHRIVYGARDAGGVGLIEVLTAGPRRDNEIYDLMNLLRSRLTDEEWAQIWEVLELVEQTASDVGLQPWDYAPDPAPAGLVEAAISSGFLDREVAEVMSKEEIIAAMEGGYTASGVSKAAALDAAMRTARAAGYPRPSPQEIYRARIREPRCAVIMPRAGQPCIRRSGHPGPHRAAP